MARVEPAGLEPDSLHVVHRRASSASCGSLADIAASWWPSGLARAPGPQDAGPSRSAAERGAGGHLRQERAAHPGRFVGGCWADTILGV